MILCQYSNSNINIDNEHSNERTPRLSTKEVVKQNLPLKFKSTIMLHGGLRI